MCVMWVDYTRGLRFGGIKVCVCGSDREGELEEGVYEIKSSKTTKSENDFQFLGISGIIVPT